MLCLDLDNKTNCYYRAQFWYEYGGRWYSDGWWRIDEYAMESWR